MIIFDLDGTLANCNHRRHFVDPEKCGDSIRKILKPDGTYKYKHYNGESWKPDWKAFFEACDKDEPIKPVIENYRAQIFHGKEVCIWSGRCESVREKTLRWLHNNSVGTSHIKELKMRPIGDHTPDDELKERWLKEALAEGKTIEYVFDDRPKVVRVWRKHGIFVFNCCQHEEEF